MNQHQEYALRNHCRLACETVVPELYYLVEGGGIVLSVNSGYE